MISFPNGVAYQIPIKPARIKEVAAWEYGKPKNALIHDFDMNKVHVIELPSTTPRVPDRARHPEWPESFWNKVVDQAMENALKAREQVAEIVAKVKHYVNVGVIEVVEGGDPDGLLEEDLELSAAESSLIAKPSHERATRAPRPSEIAKAAGA